LLAVFAKSIFWAGADGEGRLSYSFSSPFCIVYQGILTSLELFDGALAATIGEEGVAQTPSL
jgi:hypothetical protein